MRILAGPASMLTLCACCIALLLPLTALADFTDLEVVDRSSSLPICQDQSLPEIPRKLDVCEVFVVLDDPADRLISGPEPVLTRPTPCQRPFGLDWGDRIYAILPQFIFLTRTSW